MPDTHGTPGIHDDCSPEQSEAMARRDEGQARGSGFGAEAVKQRDGKGWFVAWYERNGAAAGARGLGLAEQAARDLAQRITMGAERP